jgi:hypothetical protein
MSSLSFIHLASAGKKVSTGHIVANIRKYYPDAYYFLASDAADDLKEIADLNNCEYCYYDTKVGYPSYDLEKLLLWFERFKYACSKCETTHIMMMEDDVWIKKSITVEDDWELAGQNVTVGNIIPENIIDSITEFSGKKPNKNQYGFGGGSIFKVSTFLENYNNVIEWFKNNHDTFKKEYMPLGFMDCYMMFYYFLCGKDASVNPYLTDTHHHQNNGYDYDKFVNEQDSLIEIINNYKKYYWA